MTCLEMAYYWSQICLTAIAFVAVFVASIGAFLQLQAVNLSDLVRRLEDPRIRQARRSIYLASNQRKNEPWWRDDDLNEKANELCATFDILWITAKWGNKRFFTEHWAYTICWTYEALDGFLQERRGRGDPGAFYGYRKLYELAQQGRHSATPSSPG